MGWSFGVSGKKIFLIGIKGTGMASLACMLAHAGAFVTGSDVAEEFGTDGLLRQEGIAWIESFESGTMPPDIDMVIHSAAYPSDSHPQISTALARGIPVFSYPGWLASMSRSSICYGVAGTHGKTTAAGCLDTILRNTDIPYFALYGSPVRGDAGTGHFSGDRIGILEACEYREHFLSYDLQGVVVTNIEHDHPDWYAGSDAVYAAFRHLAGLLPDGGILVCGIDSEMGKRLADWARGACGNLIVLTYGEHADSMFRLTDITSGERGSFFRLAPFADRFYTPLVGTPLCLDVAGASILGSCIVTKELGLACDGEHLASGTLLPSLLNEAARFPGCAGRLEVVAREDGVVYINDYAHHPTEISASIQSLRIAYPESRLVVVFAPHTRSRTEAFFDGFAASLSQADVVVVRPVYASARQDGNADALVGLSEHLALAASGVCIPALDELETYVGDLLRKGDVCVTMGAGNNRGLAQRIAVHRRSGRC